MADDVVTQKLEFDASQALEALQQVNDAADTTAGKANLLNKTLQDYSRSLGQSWKQTLTQFKELSGSGLEGEKFTGFQTPFGKDVTDDVFKQTEALAKRSQAMNKYVTEDSKAASSDLNFDGSVKRANVSINEQSQQLQKLSAELNNLKYPTQGRNELGQFTSPTPPSFQAQFEGLNTYQEKLQLVQKTISELQAKTNLPLKDIGRELGKSFPELLQDTNLVSTAIQNLSNANNGLSASFKPVQQTIAEVNAALSELQARGKINLSGAPAEVSASLQGTIKEVSAQTGANYEDVAAGLQRMGVSAQEAQAALSVVNKELINPSAAQYAQRLQVLQGELAKLSTTQVKNIGDFQVSTPDFAGQFKSLSTYQEQLKLVSATISELHEKTGLPFKDIGAELGKSFPELLKDTNLVATSVENLTKENAGLSTSFRTEAETITLVRQQLTELQSKGKLNLFGTNKQNVEDLKGIISEISKSTGAQFSQVGQQLQAMGVPAAQATAAVKGLNNELTKGTKEAQGFSRGIDVFRTALGTLTAVGIFSFLQLIQQAFSDTAKSIVETEGAIYNLRNAERILSQEGVEIAPKDLQATIDGIQTLVPMISKVDASKAVSSIALFTKDLGYNKQQIDDLSKSIAVLYVRNKSLGLSFDQVRSQVLTGLLTGRAQGIRDLGVSISDASIQAEALRLHLVETKKAYEALTGDAETRIKAAATLSIINKSQDEERKGLSQYLNTVDAQVGQLSATWKNFLTNIGTALASALIEYFKGLNVQLQNLNQWLVKNQATIREVVAVIAGLIAGGSKLNEIKGEGFLSKLNFKKNFQDFVQAVKDGMDQAKAYTTDFGSELDTPTEAVNNFANALDAIDTTKAQNALRDMLKSLDDLQKKMAQSEQDFQLKLQRFDQDSATEREHIVEDYNLNVLQTQRQFALRQKEANDKYRQKEKDDERKFQEQMRQLREKFLYDLEDALRERDAKQVLRLIDKYNMEKQNMINENALRKKDADEQHKQDLEQMKAQEAERLQEMAEEQAVRLQRFDEEQAVKRQRMEQDHAIEMARMKEQQDEIIRQASEKIAQEYGINEQGANALYGLLKKYYGTDGALATLTSQGYNAMLQQAGGFLAQVAGVIAQYQAMIASVAFAAPVGTVGGLSPDERGSGSTSTNSVGGLSGGSSPDERGTPHYAKGGQFVATKPTKAIFGEGGEPELVTITPLSKLGSLKNGKQPLNGVDGLDGKDGSVKISMDLNLSPDLETRVVQKSQDATAEIVSKINRTKGA